MLRSLRHAVLGTPAAACCSWVQGVAERHYGLAPARPELAALWCVWPDRPGGGVSAERQWGPVLAAEAAGLTVATWRPPTVLDPPPGTWSVVQGWRSDPTDGVEPESGHTLLWYGVADGYGVRAQSSERLGVRVDWTRWADVVAPYRHGVAVAVLRRPASLTAGAAPRP